MGTTSEKLTYLNTTKTLIKEELNLGGANITNEPFRAYKGKLEGIYKDFLANGTDTLWNNWEKVSGSGTEISLNNTIEAKMDFVYKGNTSQNGTPTPDTPIPVQVVSGDNSIKVEGKNLLINNFVLGSINAYGDDLGNNTRARSDYNIVQENSIYCFSSSNSKIYYVPYFYDENKTFISYINGWKDQSVTFTTPANTKYVRLIFKNNDTNTIVLNELTNMQLEKGSTATTYEPYQSTTYPINLGNIELCKIGNYQDKIAKSTGKNLFDTTKYTSDSAITVVDNTNGTLDLQGVNGYYAALYQIINVIPNTQYKLSYKATKIGTTNATRCFVRVRDYDDTTSLADSGNEGNVTLTFTPTGNKVYVYFSPNNAGNNGHAKWENIQLEKGNQATPYEPYGKVWYLNKQIGKVVLDGSENWVHETGSQTPTPRTVVTINSINFLNNNYYSNYFILNSTTSNRIVLQTVNSQLYLSLENELTGIINSDTNQQKVDKIKSWLSTYNTTVYYVLATPTTTEITDTTLISQLEAIKKSYNSQTNISQTNDDKPFILDVVALGELD